MITKKLKSVIIGKPLDSESLNEQKLSAFWGFPILSSDAVSSVAYAGQEILLVLLPAIGLLAFGYMTLISGAIILLLFILMLSYRQTIQHYPNGGGAYIVAKENIGVTAGVVAAAALSIDYIMTVAVSVSSGVEQLTSAFEVLKPYASVISVFLILLLMVGNLRGLKESSKIFGIPTYLFVGGMLIMIVTGAIRIITHNIPPFEAVKSVGAPVTLFLILKAFSSGCTALTGVEAVSNSVPNFKKPSRKNAKLVLLMLSIVIFVVFGGISVVAYYLKVVPGHDALLIRMAATIFGGSSFMFFFITVTTFLILILAANTSYSGFPMLLAVVAKDGYAPRQLTYRGDRLSYDFGIISLSIASAILVVIFNAQVTSLIGLYAIGVFISFTLSQSGMFLKLIREKEPKWQIKAAVNGIGAIITSIVVIIIAIAKFNQGAWIVIFIAPLLVFAMIKVKTHYMAVQRQLKLTDEEYSTDLKTQHYKNRVIVPFESVNKSSLRVLRYASTISNNIVAFSVVKNEEEREHVEKNFSRLKTDIPLKIEYSPYRKVLEPLLDYIKSEEYKHQKGELITVVLPQFTVKKRWHKLLHNNTRYFLEKELLKHNHIVVSVMPLQLKDDDEI